MSTDDRCPWAITYGVVLTTRCFKALGHEDVTHSGRGLRQFPDQVVSWIAGDRREFMSDIEDSYTWERRVGGGEF